VFEAIPVHFHAPASDFKNAVGVLAAVLLAAAVDASIAALVRKNITMGATKIWDLFNMFLDAQCLRCTK
jgi:hypothetical protein